VQQRVLQEKKFCFNPIQAVHCNPLFHWFSNRVVWWCFACVIFWPKMGLFVMLHNTLESPLRTERALDISFCLTNKIIYLPACSTLPSSSLNMWDPPNIWVMKTTFKTCLSQPLLFFEEVYKTGLETRFLRGSNVILGTLLNWRLDFLRVSNSNVSVKSKLQHPPPPHYCPFRWSNTPTPGTNLSCKASEITAKRSLNVQFFLVCLATYRVFYKKNPTYLDYFIPYMHGRIPLTY